ncbi:HXXEE domain-containing protein [SAR86 cluster bacterium]|nr:HXXEE domain-containing protein [SAR86 cluster bacterium]
MNQFKNLIVLSPLIYAIHHFEEHIIFNFIEWKLKYFSHSAAALSTEAILSILVCIFVIFTLLHLVKNNRASAYVILYILFTIQVINAFFHIFFSLYYSDFSPGTITSVLLYLPVSFFIVRTAFKEGWLKTYSEYAVIAFLGTITFVLFEIYGPIVIVLSVIASLGYYVWANKKLT